MTETVTDLVGAGDSFRTGLIGCIARHIDAFRVGVMDIDGKRRLMFTGK